jgi:CubicO group peptidase (beta-lactamase class C family)
MKRSICKPFFLLIFLNVLSPVYLLAQSASQTLELNERIRKVEQSLTGGIVVEGDSSWTIKQRMELYHVPAVTIAVIKDYKIDWAKAYGYADVSEKRLADPSTRFQAASLSKSLNAMSILKLVQDKKIDLYADINNYLSSWKFPYDSVSKNKKISTANLLSHTAGLTVHGFGGYKKTAEIPTVVEILNGHAPANSAAVRSQAEPGIRYVYSGGGTTISQLIAMDVTKTNYADYALKNVLKPIGMTNSFYGSNDAMVQGKDLATAYYASGEEVMGKYHLYPELAAAALWTTPSDLGRFIIETQLSLKGKSNKVLSQELTRLMLTPYIGQSAALGVFIDKRGAGTYFRHGGANEGFRCEYYGSMDGGDGVIVMINSENGAIMQEIINSVANVYQWKDFYKPIIKKLFPVPDEVSLSYVGKYEIAPQIILTISKENGQMKAEATGQGKLDIYPEALNKYFIKVADIRLEFVQNESGKIDKVIIFQNGGQMLAKRI